MDFAGWKPALPGGSVGHIGLCAYGLSEPGFLRRRRPEGAVAFCVDDAEKAKGLILAGQKLMGGPGSNVYGIKRLHLPGLIVQHHLPLPAHRNHHVGVGVLFQAGVAARFDFKIAQMKAGLFGLFFRPRPDG